MYDVSTVLAVAAVSVVGVASAFSSPLLSLKYGRRTNCVVVPHVDGCLLARGGSRAALPKENFEGGGKERMGDCDPPPPRRRSSIVCGVAIFSLAILSGLDQGCVNFKVKFTSFPS